MKRYFLVFLSLILVFGMLNNVSAYGTGITSDMIRIKARPDFAFRYDLSNENNGEKNPVLKDYYLSAYKVTNEQYAEFVKETAHRMPKYWKNDNYPEGKGNHPVLDVSYSDAVSYCEWLSSKCDGWTFRLPTEAEWENAAMGDYYGDNSVKYPNAKSPSYDAETGKLETSFNFNGVIAAKLFNDYGKDYVVNYIKGDFAGTSETLGECISISKNGGVSNWANHGSQATKGYFLQTDLYQSVSANGGYTTPVGFYEPNTLGLYDMAGNAWDLTSSVIVAKNGLESGVECYAVRGGSWYATARSCTFGYRGEGRKDSPSSTVGFRLAADYTSLSDEMSSVAVKKNADGKSCNIRADITVADSNDFVCFVAFYDNENYLVTAKVNNTVSPGGFEYTVDIPVGSVKCRAFLLKKLSLAPLCLSALCSI